MKLRNIASTLKRYVKNPHAELRKLAFHTLHASRPRHDIVCRSGDCRLLVRSNSVLAEPLYVGHGFEQSELRFLSMLTKPGMKVLDVGANVGLYSVRLGKCVGPSGHVWSFEPFPPVAADLRKNVVLNKLSNITVIEQALSDEVGIAEFSVFAEGQDVYNSLGASERPVEKLRAVRKISVKVNTLDEFAQKEGIDKVDIFKLDVEGAEERVLAGGLKLLQRSTTLVMLVELGTDSATQCGCSVYRAIETLCRMGFKMYGLSNNGNPHSISDLPPGGGNAVFKR